MAMRRRDRRPSLPPDPSQQWLFDGALYVIDHTSPYCTSSGRHEGNRTALCPYCDSVKTRREIASRAYKQGRRNESDGEESE